MAYYLVHNHFKTRYIIHPKIGHLVQYFFSFKLFVISISRKETLTFWQIQFHEKI